MIEIIPSIFVSDQQTFERQLKSVEGAVNMVQLDIADGVFVPATTWADPDTVKNFAEIELQIELHLMVAHPLEEIEKWIDVPQVVKVLAPVETTDDLHAVIELIHGNGWDAGLVINPDTPAEALDPYLDEIEGVMFMGVHPGQQGQSYIPETTERIANFVKKDTGIFVELDGAVNMQTLPEIITTGLDAICPGSAIFGNAQGAKFNIEQMEETIHRLTLNH